MNDFIKEQCEDLKEECEDFQHALNYVDYIIDDVINEFGPMDLAVLKTNIINQLKKIYDE